MLEFHIMGGLIMSYEVKVYHSPMYELLSSFVIFTTRKWTENLDWSYTWIEQTSELIGPELVEHIEKVHTWDLKDYDLLYLWTILHDPYTEIESCLTYLEEASIEALYDVAVPFDDELTVDKVIRIRDNYVPLLRRWNDHYFHTVEAALRPLLEEDAAEKQRLIAKMNPSDLVEYATNGVIVEPLEDLHTVMIMPMIHCRPVNYYMLFKGLLVFKYAIDIPETDEDLVPTPLTRFTRALSTESHLRILRFLSEGVHTIGEIAVRMKLSEKQVKSDLMTLRAAGLLRTHLHRRSERYSLRPDGINEMQLFMESYLRI